MLEYKCDRVLLKVYPDGLSLVRISKRVPCNCTRKHGCDHSGSRDTRWFSQEITDRISNMYPYRNNPLLWAMSFSGILGDMLEANRIFVRAYR